MNEMLTNDNMFEQKEVVRSQSLGKNDDTIARGKRRYAIYIDVSHKHQSSRFAVNGVLALFTKKPRVARAS